MEKPLPPKLRAAVEGNLRPVRPLAPPGVRTLVVGIWFVVLLFGPALLWGPRTDGNGLEPWLAWGGSLLEMATGCALVFLALREGVPSMGTTPPTLVLALVGALAVEVGVALVSYVSRPCQGCGWAGGVACFRNEMAFGLVALVLTLWLVARAFPLSPARAGLFGGIGTGLAADGVQHLLCPITDLRHLLVWHGGAVLTLGAFGLFAGWLWQRRRLHRWQRERQGEGR